MLCGRGIAGMSLIQWLLTMIVVIMRHMSLMIRVSYFMAWRVGQRRHARFCARAAAAGRSLLLSLLLCFQRLGFDLGCLCRLDDGGSFFRLPAYPGLGNVGKFVPNLSGFALGGITSQICAKFRRARSRLYQSRFFASRYWFRICRILHDLKDLRFNVKKRIFPKYRQSFTVSTFKSEFCKLIYVEGFQ